MRNRIALVAGMLALGVAACGDDVEIVQPTPEPPPPPPPVEATMAPSSAEVAVGNSVVFAVTASGGVAGEAASWTCASSNTGIATVTSTSAGCQATGVAAGSVTITASVSKSGETINVGAELTVTSDEPPVVEGDPAVILIQNVNNNVTPVSDQVNVTISMDRGDQEPEELSLLVDGEVVASQSFGSGMDMGMAAAQQDEAAEQAAPTLTLSFNSAAYGEDGTPNYMNGDHVISAELEVGIDMADGTHGHETVSSNAVTVEFKNTDGVHVVATGPGDPVMNPKTGELWYGGPEGSTFAMTVIPVMFSGGSAVESVAIRGFCGAELTTDAEAPYEFEVDCKNYSGQSTPTFVVSAGGQTLDADQSLALNDNIFPIRLDFKGPTAPVFKVNPNGREGGWLNADVNLTGENGSGAKKNGWLIYYDDDDDGVGGYIPQLRYSTSDPRKVAAARGATPSATPELPAETSSASKICFIVTATDLLGNESALPSASKDCIAAGSEGKLMADDDTEVDPENEGSGYGALVTELMAALNELDDDSDDDAAKERVADARKALRDKGLQAGVDITPPTAQFTRTSLGTNRRTGAPAREVDDNFKVTVEDARSGINEAKALVADLEVRDADGTKCVRSGKTTSSASQCGGAFKGFTYEAGDDLASTNILPLKANDVGYYTFTAQAQDKAGNLSEEISDVALSDTEYAARASVRVTEGSSSKPLAYTLDINLDDDLSVRDYYVAMTVGADVGAIVAPATAVTGTPIRLGDTEQVDGFNAPDPLTTDKDVTEKPRVRFLGLQATGAAAAPTPIDMMQVYVRDQAGASYEMDQSGARVRTLNAHSAGDPAASPATATMGDGFVTGVAITMTVTSDGTNAIAGTLNDDDDEIVLTATADPTSATDDANTEVDESEANPFKRVLFYALSNTVQNTAVGDWRFIGSVSKNDSEEDGTTANTYNYTLETDAGELAAIMDDRGADDYTTGSIIAIGIREDVAAEDAVEADAAATPPVTAEAEVKASQGVVGLVSAAVTGLTIDL